MAPSAEMQSVVNRPKLDFHDWAMEDLQPAKQSLLLQQNGEKHHQQNGVSWPSPREEEGDKGHLLDSPVQDASLKDLPRSKSAKQFTWVLLLQAHKAAGCVAWIGMGVSTLFLHIRRRLLTKEGLENGVGVEDAKPSGHLLSVLRLLLALSASLLLFEAASHSSELEWDFLVHHPRAHIWPALMAIVNFLHLAYHNWIAFRIQYVAPAVQSFADGCIYLFLVQTVDRIVLCLGCLWIKVTGYKPQPKGFYGPGPTAAGGGAAAVASDEVAALLLESQPMGEEHPMVLVQIPMCNEREVFDQSIGAACQLDWPRHRLLIQVLDDSSDDETASLIHSEVDMWARRGLPILYRRRILRQGYKAGNLKSAMSCDYVKDYEFVAIFDADFQPKPDFLQRTIPHFKDQPDVGLVQARWSFVNRDENLLTRLQNVNMCFHFEVEQQVNGAFLGFFGFNGTAGVWRISALEESGGWLDRTTVEDMDIAVRAHLAGWRMVFLNDVEAQCELPESYETYRKQQHRWHSGPMQLFRLCLPDILTSKIAWWKKCNLIFLFFLLRKMILPFYSFTLFCVILPLTMFVPEASLPLWVVCYIPGFMSLLNILPSPRSFPFMIPYLLFENTMSVTKFQAMIAGLFQLKSAQEWVVTKKMGRTSELDLAAMERKELVEAEQSKPPVLRCGSDSQLASLGKTTGARAAAEVTPSRQQQGKERALGTVTVVVSDGVQRPEQEEGSSSGGKSSVSEGEGVVFTDGTSSSSDSDETSSPVAASAPSPKQRPAKKMYRKELALAFLLLVAAGRSLFAIAGVHFYFLLFQGLTFLVVGLDLIGDSQ